MDKRKGLGKFVLIICILILGLSACGKSVEQQIAEQLELGARYLDEGNYEEAIIAFEKVISVDKKNVAAYLGIADAYIGLNELDMAKEILELGLSEIDDEQLHKKLEEVLRLIEEKRSKEEEKERETEQEDREIEESSSADTSAVEESEMKDEETTKTNSETDTAEKIVETEPLANTAEETVEPETFANAAEITAEPESAEIMSLESSTTEKIQEQGLVLKITEPISVGGIYHLEDVINGISDTTTLLDIEHQIPGLTCEVVREKDDGVGFYKDGTLLFLIYVSDILTEEEWNRYDEITNPLFEAMDIYGDFSGPNVDTLIVIEQQICDELKVYLSDKRIKKDVKIFREL